MKVKKSTVELTVANLSSSLEFYRHMLGFTLLASDQEDGQTYWALIQLDGFQMSLKQEEKQKQESFFLQRRDIGGTMLLCFEVEDIQSTYQQIKEKFDTLNLPHLTPCGATDFSMLDPDGYVITFQQL